MTRAERSRRDAHIERLFLAGKSMREIGDRYRLDQGRVREILTERGVHTPSEVRTNEGFWSGDEDRIRQRIHEKAQQGARAALRAPK